MKSIGARLRTVREEKGFTIDDVARETNIARKFITALEAEDFSSFPAEAYVLGFLKNYGEYLGLDVKDLQSQYKVLKIQEQPVPVNELLNKPSRLPRVIITCVILAAGGALAAGAVYFLSSMPHTAKTPPEMSGRAPVTRQFSGGILEQRLFKGDSVLFPSESGDVSIEVTNMGEVVTLATPEGNIMLALNQDAGINLTGDGTAFVRVTIADYEPNKPDMGVLLRFEPSGVIQTDGQETENAALSVVEQPAAQNTAAAQRIIFTGVNPYPFTLQASFQGYCMFRWEILRESDKRGRNERYMARGDEVNIQAQNGVRIWLSNAGAAKIQAIGGGRSMPVEAGQFGAVVVADILWRRGEDGRYNLIFSRLEN